MRKIGIIYGMENSFPSALVDRINQKSVPGVMAEHIHIGGIKMAEPSGYHVIIDRISHDIEFYRAYLKNAVLGGTIVINNPFWWSADDKFFNYAIASKLLVATPSLVPRAKLKNLSSALHQKGLLMMIDPDSAAFLR